MPSIRVLVVDESRYTRDFVIHNVLRPTGYTALEAADGESAIQIILHQEIDLVLLSLEIRQVPAEQVISTLNKHKLGIPVILVASAISREVAADMFLLHVHSYVLKPFTTDELLAAVEKAVGQAQAQQERNLLLDDLSRRKQELDRLLRSRDILSHIGESAISLIEPKELINQVLDAALYLTGAEEVTIYLNASDNKSLRRYRQKQRIHGTERQIPQYTEYQLAATAATSGKIAQAGPLLYSPVRLGEKVFGAIGVSNSNSARPFCAEDHYPLKVLGGYTALAMENNRLMQQVKDTEGRKKQELRGLFERYISPNIVKQILDHPETVELGGIRQRVSTLFADIRGFSKFSTRATPEVLVDVLNRHMGVAADAILAEGGTLDKFIGDAVMAYFNAPVPQPDHAVRAVRAAWRMCQNAKQLHARLPSASRLEFGIGITTGEALVGNIGAPQIMNFTIIGDAVNVSRRLQEHALGGQILVSIETYEAVRGFVEVRPAGILEVKGRSQPVPIFEVIRVRL